jgi:hypothetical protein
MIRSGQLVALGAVAGAGLLAVGDCSAVVAATDDLVTDTGEVTDAAAAEQDDGVLLEVVALSGDVGRDLNAVDETDTGDLAECRVRLLRRGGEDTGADPALLRVMLESGILGLGLGGDAALTDELVDGRQSFSPSYLSNDPTCVKAAQHDTAPNWREKELYAPTPALSKRHGTGRIHITLLPHSD